MDEVVAIKWYPTEGEADVVAALLVASGIEALVTYESPALPDGMAGVLVKAEDVRLAQQIIAAGEGGQPPDDESGSSAGDAALADEETSEREEE